MASSGCPARPPQALDLVLYEAGRRGLRVILSFSDYWGAFGAGQAGFEPYLQVRRRPAQHAHCAMASPGARVQPQLTHAAHLRPQWVAGSLNISDWSLLDFYRDPRVKLLFKANLCRMVNR